MLKGAIKQLTIYLGIAICIAACKRDSKDILNENFDANEIGWPEESTSSHKIEIQNGNYFVHSVTDDTTKVQTSVSPQRVWFLLKMPKHYEITTHIKRIGNTPTGEFGLMLLSSTLTYRFALTDSGKAYVTEYDYNTEVEDSLISGNYYSSKEIRSSGVRFRITVHERNIKFFLNDRFIGTTAIKTSQWEDIRLFTSSTSEIAIDYLRISELNKDEDEH